MYDMATTGVLRTHDSNSRKVIEITVKQKYVCMRGSGNQIQSRKSRTIY